MFDESFTEAWERRYGSKPIEEMRELSRFLAHRSVRRFSKEAVPESTVSALVASAQSAATSSNLQLWSIVSIQDAERREQIAKIAADQHQIREAAWFFAFLADHYRLREAGKRVEQDTSGLGFMEFFVMASIDAALAAERMVCAAESLGLGICYIGALRNDPPAVKELLELPDGVFALFGLCIGWPEEGASFPIKPRLPQSSIWFRERYDKDVSVSEYDERMRDFYVSEGMKGEFTWSMRSARRTSLLTGREVIQEWLRKQGFNLK